MKSINFKKLVLRKERQLIQSLLDAVDSTASIYNLDGTCLLGPAVEGASRYDIVLAGQLLGWVEGSEKAQSIATLLTSLVDKEQEKRALAKELLGKYKEISLLSSLSEKIIGSLSVKEAAALVLEDARQLLNAVSGGVFLKKNHSHLLERAVHFGLDNVLGKTVFLGEHIFLGEGIVGTIVQAGRGEIINDCLTDPRCQDSEKAPDALICVPLKNKESILGALVLSRPTSQPYSAEDLKLITTLACQSAGVINALLHEDKLKESRQNDLILRLSSQIHESLELDKILETTISELYSALKLDRCVFFWCQEPPSRLDGQSDNQLNSQSDNQSDGQSDSQSDSQSALPLGGLEVVAESKRPGLSSLRGAYSPQLASPLVQLVCQGHLLWINDVETFEDERVRQFLQTHGFRSFCAIPIRARSGQLGVIGCGTSQLTKRWSEPDKALLQAVTAQLAIALDQADLYNQSRTAAQTAQDKAKELKVTLTELQQAQTQLVQSEKMSSIGQMVAGVAHEINNPVNFIYGNLQHLENYVEDLIYLIGRYQEECSAPSRALQDDIQSVDLDFLRQDLPKTLESMSVGTRRIREIVLSLRNFSRLDQSDFKFVDIHEGLNSTLLLLRHRFNGRDSFPEISLTKTYADLPFIDCYPGQLNQVFMNILVNAMDALEEANVAEPAITIVTQQVSPDRVQVRISDNGPGISSEIAGKLFDPFFTTKEVGKGTGLGLSISYQIITERHSGTLQCHSTLGKGTEFLIELPIQQPVAPSPVLVPELTA